MSVDNLPPGTLGGIGDLMVEIWDYADPEMSRPDAKTCRRWASDLEMAGNRLRNWNEKARTKMSCDDCAETQREIDAANERIELLERALDEVLGEINSARADLDDAERIVGKYI